MYLKHCKNFRGTAPELSYNGGKCAFIILPSIQRKKPSERVSSFLQREQAEEAVQGPERGRPEPQMDSSSLDTPCAKALSTTENQSQSQALWQPSRR